MRSLFYLTKSQPSYQLSRNLQLVVAVEIILHVLATTEVTSWGAARLLVDLANDWAADALHLLELLVEVLFLSILVVIEPLVSILESLLDGLLVLVGDLVCNTLLAVAQGIFHGVYVVLEGVTCLDLVAHLLVLLSELHHAFNLLLAETTLVVSDGNLLVLASALVLSADVQDAVRVDLEGHLDLRHTARSGRDASQLEFAEQVTVLGHGTLTLEHLDEHGGLVIPM